MDQDGTCHGGGPRSRPHCARWGPSFPLQKGQNPQFLAHFYCGKMAECIKMPLGMEVGLGPGHIVLDGDQAYPPKKGGTAAPQFSDNVYCGQMAGSIKLPLGTEVGLSLGDIVLDGDPAPPLLKGHSPALTPIFGQCPLWPNGWME